MLKKASGAELLTVCWESLNNVNLMQFIERIYQALALWGLLEEPRDLRPLAIYGVSSCLQTRFNKIL